MSKHIVLCFEVMCRAEDLCDPEGLKECYGNSWERFCKEIYEEEGVFWDQKMELIEVRECDFEPLGEK